MSAVSAYRRAPLVNPVFVPFPDTAVHPEGQLLELINKALGYVDVNRMSALDSVLATRLGGYAELPPAPDASQAESLLPGDAKGFMEVAKAVTMLAFFKRDKNEVFKALSLMRIFMEHLPQMDEDALFWCGADALRLSIMLYQRTGQRFLLSLMEQMRSRLPDVSGLMHSFPFQREYRREEEGSTPDEVRYYDRMERFATGRGAADAMAMAALLGQYSGSGRDAAAPEAGLNALTRFHGMPCGAFSADPYLAGKDPAHGLEVEALCAQIEALCDALWQGGSVIFAERLERILLNALPEAFCSSGIRGLQVTNRLGQDESCAGERPSAETVSALLRALYALRRSVWMCREDDMLAYLLPVDCGCLTRMNGVPVRLTATVSGFARREVRIRVETKEPVAFRLQLPVPRWADSATLSVNGAKGMAVPQGEYYTLSRTFHSGDEILLTLTASPRLETGFRNSVSVSVANTLMALPLPEDDMAWNYALNTAMPMTVAGDGAQPAVLVAASEAPQWKADNGFILPPPQNVQRGPAYQLTLIPYEQCDGRISAFPVIKE